MNKEQVYKELNNQWNLFNMSEKEIENAYLMITGFEKTNEETILDLKLYLLEFILEQMMKDGDVDNKLAAEITVEMEEKWKLH